MQPYNVVSGILLILSIIGFALATPVRVHEKHQARVDVVHIPRGVIAVLEKRGGVEKLVEFFKTFGKLFDSGSSGSHALSSSSSTASSGDAPSDFEWWYDVNGGWYEPTHTPTSIDGDYPMSTDGDYGPYHELPGTPEPNPRPSTDDDYGPYHELPGEPALNPRPSTEDDYGPYHELPGEPASSPRPSQKAILARSMDWRGPAPNPRSSKDPDFYWEVKTEDPLPPKRPKLESSKEFGQTDED